MKIRIEYFKLDRIRLWKNLIYLSDNFRALEPDTKDAKEDAVFKQQRQANIAEVSRVKEARAKSFGGRKEVKQLKLVYLLKVNFSNILSNF